jgi:D-threo-aldose 1-dehydrogenase
MTAAASKLPLRRFGQTELLVTPLCIGCAPIGDMPRVFGYSVTEAQALATLRAAFNSLITYMDTAGAYGDGESERRIGIVLREIGGLPAGYTLATKVGRDPRSGEFGGEQVKRSVERSLRLLGVDQLQIVFLHDPENTSFEKVIGPDGPLEMLLHYKAQGIIQHIGVAGGPINLLIRYVETGAFEAVITHNRYTLLNRAAGPLLDIATRRGLAAINAAPYGGGMLAKGPDAFARYAYREASSAIIERARRMAALCEEYEVPLAAAALQFSLRDPRITSTIIGMSRAERVAQTLELARHPIPDEIWPQLDRAGFDINDL